MSGERQSAAGSIIDEVLQYVGPLVPVSEMDQSDLPIIDLSSSKVEAISLVATKRAVDGRGSIKNHERGALGEYAAAKHLGIPGEFDDEIYEDGDPGFDLMYRGSKIDVKTVGPQANNPFLQVPTRGELTADYYLLVHQLSRKCYRVIGYAPRPVVARSETFTYSMSEKFDDRYGDEVYKVDQDRLAPVAHLS